MERGGPWGKKGSAKGTEGPGQKVSEDHGWMLDANIWMILQVLPTNGTKSPKKTGWDVQQVVKEQGRPESGGQEQLGLEP